MKNSFFWFCNDFYVTLLWVLVTRRKLLPHIPHLQLVYQIRHVNIIWHKIDVYVLLVYFNLPSKVIQAVLFTFCNCFWMPKRIIELFNLRLKYNFSITKDRHYFMYLLYFIVMSKCIYKVKIIFQLLFNSFVVLNKCNSYNYVFAFLTTKIPKPCQILRRQERYLMPLFLAIFMTAFIRGVKLSNIFAKIYYRSCDL